MDQLDYSKHIFFQHATRPTSTVLSSWDPKRHFPRTWCRGEPVEYVQRQIGNKATENWHLYKNCIYYDRADENDQPHLCAHLEEMLGAQQVRKVPKSPEQISAVPVLIISTTEAGKNQDVNWCVRTFVLIVIVSPTLTKMLNDAETNLSL